MPWLLLIIPAALIAYLLRASSSTSSAGDITLKPDTSHLPDDYDYSAMAGASGTWSVPSGASGTWSVPRSALPFLDMFNRATTMYSLPIGLLARMAQQESAYNPLAINRDSGASGLMQWMPYIAAKLGFDPFDTAIAVDQAGKEMRRLYRRWGSWRMALASYNWGEGNLSRAGGANAKLPAETFKYVTAIAGDLGL